MDEKGTTAKAGWFDSADILVGCINLHPDGLYRIRCLQDATAIDELEALTFVSVEDAQQVVRWVYGDTLLRWSRITATLEFIDEYVLNGRDKPWVNAEFWWLD